MRSGDGRIDCCHTKANDLFVIGGSHSIGIPLAVATDCSFYRAVRDYAGTSGTDEWNRTGSTPDLLSIQPDAGADRWFHL